ncbi:uncharacterized protein LOC124307777 isoform X3 [Neodiprion virginianus]|uniref:uncharacterized protein LOC124307777 isoform X3 n=1 Tax=Neodiprion virginianus TaxID=2961670 RepID=UPI001EE74002|nr:uncharacterized protein LOC124307777 isoform X3 [Neodiprion virginianus]
MDAADVNGGNAEVVPNLEKVANSKANESTELGDAIDISKEEDAEVNGDLKITPKKGTLGKRKMRKSKANSTSIIESGSKPKTRGRKRKLSERENVSSEESTEFNGFDVQGAENEEPGSHVLKKLIAEAESADVPRSKRPKRSISKNSSKLSEKSNETKSLAEKDNDTDSEDNNMLIDDGIEQSHEQRIKKEVEEKSETDSIGGPHSLESEIEPQKTEESSAKSVNSSSTNSSPSAISQKSKASRVSRGASPGSAIKQKIAVDLSNPAYKEPFKYGWKRELVFRAGTENNLKRMADVYYYTPKGKKVRSFREVAEFLNTKELTIDNFTFFKEPIGIDDPEKEIIRDAKRVKDSGPATPSPARKGPGKKAAPAKKVIEETPSKAAGKSTKVAASSLKVKLPTKKATPKAEVKPPVEESEMLPPQWSSPPARRTQPAPEKTPPVKTKRALNLPETRDRESQLTLFVKTKRQLQVESEQRQHFMVSVCAGYHALSRVFQYLKVQELLRAARVCKMWRDLAAHPALWKTVRMKNSQVTDWDGLAESLKRHGTQHLDLRKMLVAGESDDIWRKFVNVIPRVTSLVRLELCRCPVSVVEDVIKTCPQLEVLSAMTIKCDSLNLGSVGNLKHCLELKLKAISGMSLSGDLTPLKELTQLTHLSLTSVKELGKKKIDVIESLTNLETLELGECSDFPDKFGTVVLQKLKKLERLRLEKGQGSCCTFDILEGVSKLEILNQLELVNFDVKNGFDKYLANCKNIKRLLIIPTYISQSATSNNMVLGGVTELSNNLTHFVWGVTLELLRVTELFVDQCNQMSKQVTGDSIPVLKPVPCLKLIEDIEDENSDALKGDDKQQPNLTNPQVDILPLPQLQKLLLTALPKTRVKILKIPFHATWRQSISDSTTQ